MLYVKPYVKRNKNDPADAEAIWEPADGAVRAGEDGEQQAALMLWARVTRWFADLTQVTNAIRGYATDVGLIAAGGSSWQRSCATATIDRTYEPQVIPILLPQLLQEGGRPHNVHTCVSQGSMQTCGFSRRTKASRIRPTRPAWRDGARLPPIAYQSALTSRSGWSGFERMALNAIIDRVETHDRGRDRRNGGGGRCSNHR